MRRAAYGVVSVVLIGAGASLVVPSAQAAPSPWWHLSSGARPSNLSGSSGVDELQQLHVSATGGEYVIANLAHEPFPLLPYDADAAEVQAALESDYPDQLVTVTEEGSGEPDTRSFGIDFPSQSVAPPFVGDGSLLEGEPLTGGEASATITQTQAGEETQNELVPTAENLGDATTANGEPDPIVLKDDLPPGLEAVAIEGFAGGTGSEARGPVACRILDLTCTFEGTLPPYDLIEVRIKVRKLAGATSGEVNRLAVSGGGVSSASLSRPIVVSGPPSPFGLETFELSPEEEGGVPASQAGSHPFQLTTSIAIEESAATKGAASYEAHAASLPKDVRFHWPAGLLANPSSVPRCSLAQFLTVDFENGVGGVSVNGTPNYCQPQTAIGVAAVTVEEPSAVKLGTLSLPIFNLEPSFGEPGRVGFFAVGLPVLIDPAVRSSGSDPDYGIDVNADNITQAAALLSTEATVWGTPGDPRHDNSRGWGCLGATRGVEHLPCAPLEQPHPLAFVTLPTSCPGTPLSSTAEADAWADQGIFSALNADLPTFDGCNRLPFVPSVHSEPTSDAATSPTGLNFDLDFTDEGLVSGEGLAQSQMKRAVVTLPEGFTTNPSVAEGLKACSLAEYEASTVALATGCNPESKIGEVEIESPLVEGKKITGGLYVAKQHENPYGNLLTIYLVARDPEIGVLVRQALKVTPDPVTGRLTTEVDDVPQLPFSHFHLAFRQGQRSALITPVTCGTYAVQADLYPYSNPGVPVQQESTFQITQGPEGQSCPNGAGPFHPTLESGTVSPLAGSYSPFVLKLFRSQGEQPVTSVDASLPEGLLGRIAGVAECSEAQIARAAARSGAGEGVLEAASPSCPRDSEVGVVNVGAGAGTPTYVTGHAYLAGPYKGAPLSLAIITPALAGPFDLGTVVVRVALHVDETTAQIHAVSDPLPHILQGIPLDIRSIDLNMNRSQFTLNPTSCAAKEVLATATSLFGATASLSNRFQVGGCKGLDFKPTLKLFLSGQTKRTGNPAIRAVLTQPNGDNANIAKTSVVLPKGLFIDNAHINNPCTRVQFNSKPVPGEGCPASSVLGAAKAWTPLLEKPEEGKIYFRSNGGERELPDLVVALRGQIPVQLVGFIDSVGKKGAEVTRVRDRFVSVPDAPVSRFELKLKGGRKGLLENSHDLCTANDRARFEFTGQNGKTEWTEPKVKVNCGKKKKHGHAKTRIK
jgi:hypothetical protein